MATTVVGKASVKLEADSSGFSKSVSSAIDGASGALNKLSVSFYRLGNDLSIAISAPITAALTKITSEYLALQDKVKEAAVLSVDFNPDFGKFNAGVQVASQKIEEISRKTALTSKFGATEIAGAGVALAQAGFNAEQVVGNIPLIVNLATAGFLGIQEAAQIATTATVGFGLDINTQLSQVSDIVLTVASKTNAEVKDLGEAFKYIAPIAGAYKVSIVDVSSALGALAQVGIKGSLGGTGIKSIFGGLLNPSKQARAELAALGVNAVTAEGNLKPLAVIFKQIAEGEELLGRNANYLKLFGLRGGPAAAALISDFKKGLLEGGKSTFTGLQDLLGAQGEGVAGFAANLSKSISESTSFKLKEFINFLKEIGFQVINSGLLKSLTDLVEKVQSTLRKLIAVNPDIIKSIAKFALIAVAIGPIVRVVGFLTQLLNPLAIVIGTLGSVAGVFAAGLLVIGGAFVLAYKFSEPFRDLLDYLKLKLEFLFDSFRAGSGVIKESFLAKLKEAGEYLGGKFVEAFILIDKFLTTNKQSFINFGKAVGDALSGLKDVVLALFPFLGAFVGIIAGALVGAVRIATPVLHTLAGVFRTIAEAIKDLRLLVPDQAVLLIAFGVFAAIKAAIEIGKVVTVVRELATAFKLVKAAGLGEGLLKQVAQAFALRSAAAEGLASLTTGTLTKTGAKAANAAGSATKAGGNAIGLVGVGEAGAAGSLASVAGAVGGLLPLLGLAAAATGVVAIGYFAWLKPILEARKAVRDVKDETANIGALFKKDITTGLDLTLDPATLGAQLLEKSSFIKKKQLDDLRKIGLDDAAKLGSLVINGQAGAVDFINQLALKGGLGLDKNINIKKDSALALIERTNKLREAGLGNNTAIDSQTIADATAPRLEIINGQLNDAARNASDKLIQRAIQKGLKNQDFSKDIQSLFGANGSIVTSFVTESVASEKAIQIQFERLNKINPENAAKVTAINTAVLTDSFGKTFQDVANELNKTGKIKLPDGAIIKLSDLVKPGALQELSSLVKDNLGDVIKIFKDTRTEAQKVGDAFDTLKTKLDKIFGTNTKAQAELFGLQTDKALKDLLTEATTATDTQTGDVTEVTPATAIADPNEKQRLAAAKLRVDFNKVANDFLDSLIQSGKAGSSIDELVTKSHTYIESLKGVATSLGIPFSDLRVEFDKISALPFLAKIETDADKAVEALKKTGIDVGTLEGILLDFKRQDFDPNISLNGYGLTTEQIATLRASLLATATKETVAKIKVDTNQGEFQTFLGALHRLDQSIVTIYVHALATGDKLTQDLIASGALVAPLAGEFQTPLAEGGIFNRATSAIVGEDGPEAVIPLSKPARARELLRQSGLADFILKNRDNLLANTDSSGISITDQVSGGKSTNLNNTYNIYGTSPEAVASEINARNKASLRRSELLQG